jgi:hypothetical protein
VVQGSGPHLLLTPDQLKTTKDAWQRSSYEAVATLTGEAKSPGGRSCWMRPASSWCLHRRAATRCATAAIETALSNAHVCGALG